MKKYVNGKYVDLTKEEINTIINIEEDDIIQIPTLEERVIELEQMVREQFQMIQELKLINDN